MSIDDRLLQANTTAEKETDQEEPEASTDRAGELRRSRRGGGGSPAADWHAHRGMKRRVASSEETEQPGKQVGSEMSLSVGSSRFLQAAWRNMIYTFGLSFFYLYVHLGLRNIFGERMFAPLGAEWSDKPGMTVKQRDAKGEPKKNAENFLASAVSLTLFLGFIGVLAIFSLMIGIITNPIQLIFGAFN